MKVKVSQLKTHFSRYLKNLEEAGQIEVCLREEPVAYLTAVTTKASSKEEDLVDKVAAVGLVLHRASRRPSRLRIPPPTVAGDGRADLITVESMRANRDY